MTWRTYWRRSRAAGWSRRKVARDLLFGWAHR